MAPPKNMPTAPNGVLALSVAGVSKIYTRMWLQRGNKAGQGPKGTRALSDVSFTVSRGEMVGLLGPNGAGKTTLLKIIATLLYPSAGRVEALGADVFAKSTRTRGMMGLVTCDERSFYWRLTGRQNLLFFASLFRVSRQRAEARIGELLDALGLADAADRPYHGYSSGMKQKLAIARGLLSDPQIMLYDEPTRSLDPLSARNIRHWIMERRRRSSQQTHMIATNTLHEAELLCDRVLIINHGRIVAQGTIDEIRRQWRRDDHETHHVTCRGCQLNGLIRVRPENGLLDVRLDATGKEGTTVQLRTEKGGAALSDALRTILDAGGTIVRCATEEDTFDKVFFALLESRGDGGGERRADQAVEEGGVKP